MAKKGKKVKRGKKGRLTIIAGPMFAGKTNKALTLFRVLTRLGHPVLCFKAEVAGSGGLGHTNTHDERALPVIFIDPDRPERILKYIFTDKMRVIIDNINFFPEEKAKKVVSDLLKKGVDVYATGLLYDYTKKPFGATLSLFKKADEKIELFAICVKCGKRASHTERVSGKTGKIASTKEAEYFPVCGKCHRVYKG